MNIDMYLDVELVESDDDYTGGEGNSKELTVTPMVLIGGTGPMVVPFTATWKTLEGTDVVVV